MTEAFFTKDEQHGDRFRPTAHCRGPWVAEHCHAGPPTGLLARAMEQLMVTASPQQRLTRITVELTRPIPFAGFDVGATLIRKGRTVSTVDAHITALDGKHVLSARGLFMKASDEPLNYPADVTALTQRQMTQRHYGSPEAARDGAFPITHTLHGLPAFNGSGVQTRYPDGQDNSAGRTIAWLKTVPLFADETASPFQRICPLADCGNAFGRLTDPGDITFMNTDLTVLLHRDPQGDWLGTDSECTWETSGIGMSDTRLFDAQGVVGRALQTLLIRSV